MPEALHFTGNDEADRLLASDPLALLIGFALDQQVPVQTAFTGPLKIKQRVGSLDAEELAGMQPERLDAVFREKPAVHRFPGTMATRVQELARAVVSDPNADLGPDDRALLLCNNFSQVHRAMTRKEPPSHWVVVWVI